MLMQIFQTLLSFTGIGCSFLLIYLIWEYWTKFRRTEELSPLIFGICLLAGAQILQSTNTAISLSVSAYVPPPYNQYWRLFARFCIYPVYQVLVINAGFVLLRYIAAHHQAALFADAKLGLAVVAVPVATVAVLPPSTEPPLAR
jgi:ABC-type transport system involved in multi-copper enzyme maturation permease subunit